MQQQVFMTSQILLSFFDLPSVYKEPCLPWGTGKRYCSSSKCRSVGLQEQHIIRSKYALLKMKSTMSLSWSHNKSSIFKTETKKNNSKTKQEKKHTTHHATSNNDKTQPSSIPASLLLQLLQIHVLLLSLIYIWDCGKLKGKSHQVMPSQPEKCIVPP